MSSLDSLHEQGVAGFVNDHPWLFAIGVGLVGASLAVSNGVSPFPAFANMFLVGAFLGLAFTHATDIVSFAQQLVGTASERTEINPDRALHQLRERYAAGALSDAEFEHKLERLLETETRESAREHVLNGQREVVTE